MLYGHCLLWGGLLGLVGGPALGVAFYILWFRHQSLPRGEWKKRVRTYASITALATTLAGVATGVILCYTLHGSTHSPFLAVVIGTFSGLLLGAIVGCLVTLGACIITGADGQAPIGALFVGFVCALINGAMGSLLGVAVAGDRVH